MLRHSLTLLALLVLSPAAQAEELRIPGATAYGAPDFDQLRAGREGIRNWQGNALAIQWYGELKSAGEIRASVAFKDAPAGAKYRLSIGDQKAEAAAGEPKDGATTVSFGSFKIAQAGYTMFRLESLNAPDARNGDVLDLILDGEAVKDAHFNLKPRRNAASVHLAYPGAGKANVSALYVEAKAVTDPIYTFYMAAGWHRGYFGMQVNHVGERRIIFSVWDSGNEGVDRDKVKDEDRVTLIAKGDGVFSGDFGNEGTGGHSHLKYMWKTGTTQRFLTTAQPVDATHTVYAGYYWHPDSRKWMLISAWRAPKDGGWLKGLHSFSENFGGSNGHLQRKCLFGNQWYRREDGKWNEVPAASFSHDGTGKEDRLDRFMGIEEEMHFLSHGGYVPGFTKYGEVFPRPAPGKAPADVDLPPLPSAK